MGGEKQVHVDFRIISATNKDLKNLIDKGKFRNDLFYRLNVIPIEMITLRCLQEDIEPLAEFFIKKFNKKYLKNVVFSSNVFKAFKKYSWYGNIRELENLVERLVVINHKGLVTLEELPKSFINGQDPNSFVLTHSDDEGTSLKKSLEELEKNLILDAYKRLKNSYKVAEYFNISQPSAARRIKKYLNEG